MLESLDRCSGQTWYIGAFCEVTLPAGEIGNDKWPHATEEAASTRTHILHTNPSPLETTGKKRKDAENKAFSHHVIVRVYFICLYTLKYINTK